MKNVHLLTMTSALLCGLASEPSLLSAERQTPALNARQHAQQGRISQGVRSGELTAEERKKLGNEQQALRVEERAYKADGKITTAERKDLHQDANQVSRDIYRQKHDGQVSAPRPVPARPVAPGINARQRWQQERVTPEVRSGQLPRAEAAQPHQEPPAARAEPKAYKADGKLPVPAK
jgi:hypothetical protein